MNAIHPIALCTALMAAGIAQAESPGGLQVLQGVNRDYMVLRQPQAPADVTLTLRPVAGQAIPSQVERFQPGTPQLRAALSINWFAQASCRTGLVRVTISGPGGSRVQQFPAGQNTISGRTLYQSFEVDAVDDVCVAWAEEILAECGGPSELGRPGCNDEETFTFDRDDPLPGSAAVVVGGSCDGGAQPQPIQLPQRPYVPRLTLTCRLIE